MRRVNGLVIGAMGLLFLAPTVGRADPILRVQSVTARPGTSGFFDVFLDIPPGDPAISLASFTIDVNTLAGQGIQFTSVQTSEQAGQPYVFPGGSGFVATFAIPFSSDPFPNTSFLATDSTTILAGQNVGPGPFTVGLARVAFTVDPTTAAGSYPLTLGPLTGLADANGNTIPFQIENGALRVVMPEPATWVLFGVVGLATWYRRRRQRA